jgi:hypothetical protein
MKLWTGQRSSYHSLASAFFLWSRGRSSWTAGEVLKNRVPTTPEALQAAMAAAGPAPRLVIEA